MLVRTVQHNVANSQDPYVYTNCLAALANMAPAFRKIHPYAAQRLVTLIDLLTRKYVQLSSLRLPHVTEGQNETEERQVHGDFVRIALEALNLAFAGGLVHNEHLVYALLERKHVFNPLRHNVEFAELLENIDRVLEHFGRTVVIDEGVDAQGPCSVGQVLEHIRLSSREWSTHRLLQVADLKFTYEQEAAPEAFFTPYVWQLVLEHSGIKWQVGEQTCSQPPGSNIDRGKFEL